MEFQRADRPVLLTPKPAQVERELRKLRRSHAVLTAPDGAYLQTGGSGGGRLLEMRRVDGRHFRGRQAEAVVPFEDGTEIRFSGSAIRLDATEWFSMNQVVEVFLSYLASVDFPPYLEWRDITELVT